MSTVFLQPRSKEISAFHPSTSMVSQDEWIDWRWQQRNAVTNIEGLLRQFPHWDDEAWVARIRSHLGNRKLTLTPYTLRLIAVDGRGNPDPHDPVWRQFVPDWVDETGPSSLASSLDYDGESENWELPSEMVTPICQHKYDNRVIVRLSNVCHAYCQFCYEALRTLEKETTKPAMRSSDWSATLDYIAAHPALDEVILSGGEPLMHSDTQLDGYLGDLRALRPDLVIRIHTRALTFNPYRITDALLDSLARHRVGRWGCMWRIPTKSPPNSSAPLNASDMLARSCLRTSPS